MRLQGCIDTSRSVTEYIQWNVGVRRRELSKSLPGQEYLYVRADYCYYYGVLLVVVLGTTKAWYR